MTTWRGGRIPPGPRCPPNHEVGEILGMIDMSDRLITDALATVPAFPPPGRWTPMTYPHRERAAAATDIANAIRTGAYMLTTEERARLAVELLIPHSTDHAHDDQYGEPA